MSKENAIKFIDGALQTGEQIFSQLRDILHAAKLQIKNLEEERIKAEEEKNLMETIKNRLEKREQQLEEEKERLEQQKKKLEEETKKLELEKQEKDKKIGALNAEQLKLLDEYEKVKIELKKFAQTAAQQEEAELNFEKIQALLSIYRVLIEEIWQGQAHYRILHVLHGAKDSMNRQELKNSTGVAGAFVLRSVQELARVDLIDYDEETGTATLKRRLYPKGVE
ncbi:MAG: hypothetical protein JW891_11405 [Candidatus Lokiarchaeota archaeon]|nr:hypothetical protein [Candidatus Lokiarchaeota archaeon]